MALIALIAAGLRVPAWWHAAGLRVPAWWEPDRQKPVRDTWNGPVVVRVTRHDDLRSALARFQAATANPRVRYGLWIFVDTGALRELGLTLGSPLGADLDARGMPAREFLRLALKPMGLACKLQGGEVLVTSEKTLDEPLFIGHHGEIFCDHEDGPWEPIMNKRPGP